MKGNNNIKQLVYKRKSVINSLSYCLFLGHANSALNPIVYCFMTRNFRQSVYDVLCQGTNGNSRCKIQKNDTAGIPNSRSVRAQSHYQNSHSKKFSKQDLEKEKLSSHQAVDQPVIVHTSDIKTPKKVKQIYTPRHESSEPIKSHILKTKQDQLSQVIYALIFLRKRSFYTRRTECNQNGRDF
uniref:G-protein coupled receptors family 1 profile domain-containing protein n=1 Tax=Trichogramma kaykai TaxID=54128 RepID=A0ABD2WUF7_9HYME